MASEWRYSNKYVAVDLRPIPNLQNGIPQEFKQIDTTACDVFVAAGSEFLNLRRARAIKVLRSLGLELASWKDSEASIHPSARIGVNCWIGAKAVVAVDAVLEDGVVLNTLVSVGLRSVIGSGAWLETGVIIQNDCRIGNGSVLAPRVTLAPHIKVGKLCELGVAGTVVDKDIPDRFYFHRNFEIAASIC